jgi:hypothetical protein
MLIRKSASGDVPVRFTPRKFPVEAEAVAEQGPAQDVEITSLEIEQDPDQGGDPYNRTGQHCVVEIPKDE